jgi:TnpA family transposase
MTHGFFKSSNCDRCRYIYEHNLRSAYHIRSGGWGGLGDYHVADTSIALCSSCMAGGGWEAVSMLDGLLEHRSEIRPDTLQAEPQGQAETVVGLAYLRAIQLRPRMRNGKSLTRYVPTAQFAVEDILPIRELCSEAIDWPRSKTHLPDMLRVALSISPGNVRCSTILRKLGTDSRQNKLFVAFRALGRVVRTMFLLRCINERERRRTINAATTIAEAWHGVIQWVAFGGDGVIRQNNRDAPRKSIRYKHLVAH